MGVLGRIFGTDEAIKQGIETVGRGLDALVYTKQEQANDDADATSEARMMLVKWMEASQGHRLSRRV